MSGSRFDDEPEHCECCGTAAEEIAVDDSTGLCLYCQPCPWCGRQGTGCDDRFGSNACDPHDYPGQPRRDYNEVMSEIAAARRERFAHGTPENPTNTPYDDIAQMSLHDGSDPDCRFFHAQTLKSERWDHCIVCAPRDGDPSLKDHVEANWERPRKGPVKEPPRRWLP